MLKEIPVKMINIIPNPEEREVKKVVKDTKVNRINIFTNCGESVIVDKVKPCYICKTLTNRYEISYGAPLCSDRCHEKMNKDFYDWCERGGKE